jgi:hypothetical protein
MEFIMDKIEKPVVAPQITSKPPTVIKTAVEQDKPVDKKPTKTQADKIWDQIKEVRIAMYSLPNQKVEDFCEPIKIEPTKLYLQSKAGALLPALEEALSGKFIVDRMERYLVVSAIE